MYRKLSSVINSQKDTFKYLDGLHNKPEYEWRKIKELRKTYSYLDMFWYYYTALFHNRIYKFRFMKLNARLNVALSDIEGLKQSSSEYCREMLMDTEFSRKDQTKKIEELNEIKQKYQLQIEELKKEGVKEEGMCIEEKTKMIEEETYQASKVIENELDEINKRLNYTNGIIKDRNNNYLIDIKNEHTTLLYNIEKIIYKYQDLMWFSNSPLKQFIDKYIERRNKICNLKNFFKLTNQLPSYRESNEIKKEEDDDDEEGEMDINSIKINIDENVQDTNFLKKYILDYHECTYDKTVQYDLSLHHTLVDNEREIDIYNITCELLTLRDFIKVSVDSNDQLPFKVFLFICNTMILIGEYLWNTYIKI